MVSLSHKGLNGGALGTGGFQDVGANGEMADVEGGDRGFNSGLLKKGASLDVEDFKLGGGPLGAIHSEHAAGGVGIEADGAWRGRMHQDDGVVAWVGGSGVGFGAKVEDERLAPVCPIGCVGVECEASSAFVFVPHGIIAPCVETADILIDACGRYDANIAAVRVRRPFADSQMVLGAVLVHLQLQRHKSRLGIGI